METTPNGLSLVFAVTLAGMGRNLELDIVITHCLFSTGCIAPHSAPVTKLVHATHSHARFMGTFQSGLSFRAVAKRAG